MHVHMHAHPRTQIGLLWDISFLQTLQIWTVDPVYVRVHVPITVGAVVHARLNVDESVDIVRVDWGGNWDGLGNG